MSGEASTALAKFLSTEGLRRLCIRFSPGRRETDLGIPCYPMDASELRDLEAQHEVLTKLLLCAATLFQTLLPIV